MQRPSRHSGSRSTDRLLTDFLGGGLPLEWALALDDAMGGGSRATFAIADGVLSLEGALDVVDGGFASVRTRPAELSLGAETGLRLSVRGDGRVYQVRLYPQGLINHMRISYRARFRPEPGAGWEVVHLPFDDFQPTWRGHILDGPQLDPTCIAAVGFMIADGLDAPFRLEVGSIFATNVAH